MRFIKEILISDDLIYKDMGMERTYQINFTKQKSK